MKLMQCVALAKIAVLTFQNRNGHMAKENQGKWKATEKTYPRTDECKPTGKERILELKKSAETSKRASQNRHWEKTQTGILQPAECQNRQNLSMGNSGCTLLSRTHFRERSVRKMCSEQS